MARKKKNTDPSPVIKFIFVLLLALALGVAVCKGAFYLLVNAPYFQIKAVVVDPSLQVVEKEDLNGLIGKSIFAVDLGKVQGRLVRRYPQVSQLRIVRKFPNQIWVVAKQRLPFAQTVLKNRTLTLDHAGVVISMTSKRDDKIPLITGLDDGQGVALGRPLRGAGIHTALRIIAAFNETRALGAHQIHSLDVTNLSQINMSLDNKLRVIVDKDDPVRKMKILALVLSTQQLDFMEVKYLDLRFKEPIIGKK